MRLRNVRGLGIAGTTAAVSSFACGPSLGLQSMELTASVALSMLLQSPRRALTPGLLSSRRPPAARRSPQGPASCGAGGGPRPSSKVRTTPLAVAAAGPRCWPLSRDRQRSHQQTDRQLAKARHLLLPLAS
jgi:hypothetical protein